MKYAETLKGEGIILSNPGGVPHQISLYFSFNGKNFIILPGSSEHGAQ